MEIMGVLLSLLGIANAWALWLVKSTKDDIKELRAGLFGDIQGMAKEFKDHQLTLKDDLSALRLQIERLKK